MTAPISSTMVASFTSSWPPAASTPLAMNTIVSVLATVYRNQASSHQANRRIRYDVALDDAGEADQLAAQRSLLRAGSARPPPVVLVLVLERAAGGVQERLLQRVGAVEPLDLVDRRPGTAARRGGGSRSGRPAPRPRPCRACRAGWSSRARARIWRMNACTSSFERGSSPVVGSSSSSSTGAVSSARASAIFCCMPRDRSSIGSSRRSGGNPTMLQDLGDAGARLARRQAVEAGRVAEVLDRRHALEERRLDRDPVDQPLHARGLANTSMPNTSALPPSCSSSVDSRRTSVDFPEPFWPRMATHSPRAIRKLRPCSAATRRRGRSRRRAVAADELLAQVVDRDGRKGGHGASSLGRGGTAGAAQGPSRAVGRVWGWRRAQASARRRARRNRS